MTSPDPDLENEWTFPRNEARALVVLATLLPAAAAVVFSGIVDQQDNKPYVVPAFIVTFAVGLAAALLTGRAQKRRGRSPWRGGTWEDLQSLKAAVKQSGWPPAPIWAVVVLLNAAALGVFVHALRSVG